MKLISLLILLPTLCLGAGMKKESSYVLPLKFVDYPIEKFVADYASLMEKTILVDKRQLQKSKSRVNLILNKKTNLQDFAKMFYTIIESHGFTAVTEGSFLRIIATRDIRYTPTKLYDSNEFPKTDEYILVLHKLKNPLASEITRNMRPFMSRYGRIIDFNDAHSIAIQDRGSNINRLINLIDNLDNSKSVTRLKKNVRLGKNKKRAKKEKESKEELEIKILKLQKIKLENDLGLGDSHPGKRRL